MSKIRAAVLHVNSAPYASMSPTMQIARFVSQELGVPLVHDIPSSKKVPKKLDVLFLRSGVLKFSSHRDKVLELCENAHTIVNLEMDYAWPPDKRLTGSCKHYTVLSTIPALVKKHGGQYVNFNMVPFINPAPDADMGDGKIPGLFYWGKWREGRGEYLQRWLEGNSQYDVHISTFKKSKFSTLGDVAFHPTFKNSNFLKNFQLTMYMEDKASHVEFHSPAQRFYESLLRGLPMVFEESAKGTLEQAGYNVDKFVVTSKKEVVAALKNSKSIGAQQQKKWGRNYAKELRAQLHGAVKKMFKGSTFK